jgi:hypothetical protein
VSALDGAFGLRRLFIDGAEVVFKNAIEFLSPSGSTLETSSRTAYKDDGTPYEIQQVVLPAGQPGSDLSRPQVRIAADVNLTLFGAYTHQGVALQVDDEVLAGAQTDGREVGTYVVKAGAWVRRDDWDSSADCITGMGGLILEGKYTKGRWELITPAPMTLGTTAFGVNLHEFHDTSADPVDTIYGKSAAGLTEATKIQNRHVDNGTLAPVKLDASGGSAGLGLGYVGGVVSWAALGLAIVTGLGSTLTTRATAQLFGLEASDNGSSIQIQRPAREPRVSVYVIRTDNITDFTQVPVVGDGVTLGKRRLIWALGQTNPAERGLYWVSNISSIDGKARCERLTDLEQLATAAEGGLQVWVRNGDTSANTIRRVTDFTASSVSAASKLYPFQDVKFNDCDVEDFATSAEYAAATNWEPAVRRFQQAMGDGGGRLHLRRRFEYLSTATWHIVRRGITITGVGPSDTAGGTLLTFSACAGIHFHDFVDLRRDVKTVMTNGGAVSGLAAINGYTPVDGDRILRASTGRATTTTGTFVQPAVSSSVSVPVVSTAGYSGGETVTIVTAGIYTVASVIDGTHLSLTNTGSAGNLAPGATVPTALHVGGDPNDGLWVAHSGAWTRPVDYDVAGEFDRGCRVHVTAGTHAGETWEQTSYETPALVPGTTPVEWAQATADLGFDTCDVAYSRISGVALRMTGTPGNLDDASGIKMRSPVIAQDVFIAGFSAYGVDGYSDHTALPPSGANECEFNNVFISGCGLDGLRTQGGDANSSRYTGLHCSANGTRGVAGSDNGINESSFLGNNYFGANCAANGGAVLCGGSSNRSTFVGLYAEGDNGSDISPPSQCINPRTALRVGATSVQIPGTLSDTAGFALSGAVSYSDVPTAGVRVRYSVFGTGSFNVREFKCLGSGDTDGYTEVYVASGGDGTAGTWQLEHKALTGRAAWGLTGPAHARSYGQPWARMGLLIGGPAASDWKIHCCGTTADLPTTSTLTTGTANRYDGAYRTGDWMIVANPGVGEARVYRCTNAGALNGGALTWTPFVFDNDSNVNLTAQTASIGSSNLLTAPVVGLYEIDYYLCCTTADAGTPAVSVQLTIGHTDRAGATTQTSAALSLAAVGRDRGKMLVEVASGNITYATTVVTAGSAQYSLRVQARRVG